MIVAGAAAVPLSAHASSVTGDALITVGGAPLSGSVQAPKFLVGVAAPAGTSSVKFVLDGVYLGQDAVAPYQFAVATSVGSHVLEAHWSGTSSVRIGAAFTVSATGAATGAPAPTSTPTPAPTPTSTPSASSTISVTTSAQLAAALTTALAGQTIALADGTYTGKFTAAASGRSDAPITLRGSRAAILTAGGLSAGNALHVTGSYWNIQGISVTQSSKGVVLDGSQYTVLSGIDVGFTGEEGVHFRANSSFSSLVGSSVHDTGLTSQGYGEGVYVGSASSNWASVMGSSTTPDRTDHVLVNGNHLTNTSAEGIDVKEGTTGGTLTSNTFSNAGYSGANYGDSWVDLKGNGYTVSGNSGSGTMTDAFQVHQAVSGWGDNNVFSSNTVNAGVPGYLVNVEPGASGNVVRCQTTLAGRGVSNIGCAP